MVDDLRAYEEVVASVEAELYMHLANGRSTSRQIAITRCVAESLKEELSNRPRSVLDAFERKYQEVLSGPLRWYEFVVKQTLERMFPHEASPLALDAYGKKLIEYADLAASLAQKNVRYKLTKDRQRGRSYLQWENPSVARVMELLAEELLRWYREYPIDREFYVRRFYLKWTANDGYLQFLTERPDIVALLRVVQSIPHLTESSDVPVDRPVVVEAVELAIGLVPVVGSLVAAYEAYAGVDLFNYKLTELERGIVAATVMLPLAGRVVKGGRAIYTEARLVALYGRDAATWSKVIRTSAKASVTGGALQVIIEAETAIRTGRGIYRPLAQRAASSLRDITQISADISTTIDESVSKLLSQLHITNPVLKDLDGFALERILDKGPNLDHLKGQLLEEL